MKTNTQKNRHDFRGRVFNFADYIRWECPQLSLTLTNWPKQPQFVLPFLKSSLQNEGAKANTVWTQSPSLRPRPRPPREFIHNLQVNTGVSWQQCQTAVCSSVSNSRHKNYEKLHYLAVVHNKWHGSLLTLIANLNKHWPIQSPAKVCVCVQSTAKSAAIAFNCQNKCVRQ